MTSLSFEDRNRLVEENLRLAFWHARQLPTFSIEREELEGEALLALTEASRSFDPSKGVPFVGWAGKVIRGKLLNLLTKARGITTFEVPMETLPDALAEGNPDDSIAFREVVEAAWTEALTAEEVSIVALIAVRGFEKGSLKELAVALHLNPTTVRHHYHRLLERVRHRLGED